MGRPDPRDALSGEVFHPPGLFAPQQIPSLGVGPLGLLPYHRWTPSDSRPTEEFDQGELKARLLQVVNAEGPTLASTAGLACNAWRRKPRSGDGHRLQLVAHELLVDRAIQVRGVIGKWGTVLHPTGSPSVVVRVLGPRRLTEVPPSEIVEVMIRTQEDLGNEMRVWKATLAVYGLGMLLPEVKRYLARCLRLARQG